MDAWIDCVSDLEPTTILLSEVNGLPAEFFEEILDCSAIVNLRELEAGRPAIITLAYHRQRS